MAPSIGTVAKVATDAGIPAVLKTNAAAAADNDTAGKSTNVRPLQLSGALDKFAHKDVTPVIGREFPTLQLRDVLNDDAVLRDLAITISRRGVVFLRRQTISPDEQKWLTDRLGHLTGKPATSGLHIHPISNAERAAEHLPIDDKGTVNKDNEISVISSKARKDHYADFEFPADKDEWHSDITFEPVPSDYTSLKVHTLPPTGGDTLWSSGYEIYDRLSAPFKAFADTLSGTYAQPKFNEAAARGGFRVHPGPRGNPLNVGTDLKATHPFVRTNPVTGWKSVFGLGHHFKSLDGLHAKESELIKDYLLDLVASTHSAQVRFKWGKDDLAIWDNRSVYHAATPDYYGLGDRGGVRAVSLGEKPFYDTHSISRRDELGEGRLI